MFKFFNNNPKVFCKNEIGIITDLDIPNKKFFIKFNKKELDGWYLETSFITIEEYLFLAVKRLTSEIEELRIENHYQSKNIFLPPNIP